MEANGVGANHPAAGQAPQGAHAQGEVPQNPAADDAFQRVRSRELVARTPLTAGLKKAAIGGSAGGTLGGLAAAGAAALYYGGVALAATTPAGWAAALLGLLAGGGTGVAIGYQNGHSQEEARRVGLQAGQFRRTILSLQEAGFPNMLAGLRSVQARFEAADAGSMWRDLMQSTLRHQMQILRDAMGNQVEVCTWPQFTTLRDFFAAHDGRLSVEEKQVVVGYVEQLSDSLFQMPRARAVSLANELLGMRRRFATNDLTDLFQDLTIDVLEVACSWLKEERENAHHAGGVPL